MTYCWKALDKDYNFALDLIAIGGLHRKLCALKVVGILNVGILDVEISGVPKQKAIWMSPSWNDVKYTIKVKVVASPKFGSW